MSTIGRQTFEAAVVTAHSTKANTVSSSLATLNAAYLTAKAAYDGTPATYATYNAAIAAADAAHQATIFAAEQKRQQDVLTAANALRSADGVGPSGFGSN